MKKLILLTVALVMALSACVQNNSKPTPKVGDKMYYDVTNITPEGKTTISLVSEVTDVNDSTTTVSQTFTFPDGNQITNSYTSLIEKEYTDVSLKSIFVKYLEKFEDSLEFVEGTDFVRYQNDINEKSVFEPARMVLKYTADGSDIMIELSVEERTVHGKEKVTTPAGTFDCIKFSENHVAKIGDEEFFTQLVCWYDIKNRNEVKQTDLGKEGDINYELVLTKTEYK